MQIQVNSDQSVAVDPRLSTAVETTIRSVLGRFDDRITRIEVHLSDVNGDKSGGMDKHCLIEARVAGKDPVAVTNKAPNTEMAVSGASRKMATLLSSSFGRLGESD